MSLLSVVTWSLEDTVCSGCVLAHAVRSICFQTHAKVKTVSFFQEPLFWVEPAHTVPTLCECKHMSVSEGGRVRSGSVAKSNVISFVWMNIDWPFLTFSSSLLTKAESLVFNLKEQPFS